MEEENRNRFDQLNRMLVEHGVGSKRLSDLEYPY